MRTFSKKVKTLILTATAAAIIAAAVAVLLCNNKTQNLVLSAPDGSKYASFELQDDSVFSVSFIHSVNKSRVEEFYCAIDGGIVLTECIYYGFGAGVLTETEPGWTLTYGEDGEMIVSNMDLPMPGLSYIVGTVSDHILKIDGTAYSLRDLCGRNAKVGFSIEYSYKLF